VNFVLRLRFGAALDVIPQDTADADDR
jgi:hypothetical protein